MFCNVFKYTPQNANFMLFSYKPPRLFFFPLINILVFTTRYSVILLIKAWQSHGLTSSFSKQPNHFIHQAREYKIFSSCSHKFRES